MCRARKLGRFHPVGSATGTVDASWKGSPKDAEVAFVLDVSPPQHSAPGELPVTAHVQGKYRAGSDSLELAQFNLSTPASRMQASGTLAASSTVHFSLSTSNLEEWRPLVTALGGPTNVPFRVDGNAAFNGVAGGTISAPTLAGTLVAQDFEFTMPATSRTPEKPVHWDSLAASVQFSSHDLAFRGGSLHRGDTSADFDVSATLQKGQFTESSPFTARVNLHHVDVASTAALAGFDYPVSGTADVSLRSPGRVRIRRCRDTFTQPMPRRMENRSRSSTAIFTSLGARPTLSNIRLTHEDAEVSGSAAYAPATRGYRLDLVGKNFDLSRIRQIQVDRLPVEGRADFTLQGTGTLDAPVINAAVHARDLTLDHELAGGLDLEAATRDGQLHLSGHSEFLRGALSVEGNVGMRGRISRKYFCAHWISSISTHCGAPIWAGSLPDTLRWAARSPCRARCAIRGDGL